MNRKSSERTKTRSYRRSARYMVSICLALVMLLGSAFAYDTAIAFQTERNPVLGWIESGEWPEGFVPEPDSIIHYFGWDEELVFLADGTMLDSSGGESGFAALFEEMPKEYYFGWPEGFDPYAPIEYYFGWPEGYDPYAVIRYYFELEEYIEPFIDEIIISDVEWEVGYGLEPNLIVEYDFYWEEGFDPYACETVTYYFDHVTGYEYRIVNGYKVRITRTDDGYYIFGEIFEEEEISPMNLPSLTVSPTLIPLSAQPSSRHIQVTSNRQWAVAVSANAVGWLSAANFTPANRTGNGSFWIHATINNGIARQGTVTVTLPGTPSVSRTITVSQPAGEATLSLSTGSWQPSSAASQATINVTSSRNWTVSSNATSWLTATPTTGSGNGSFRLNATANPNTTSRSGTITVTALGAPTRTISVTQAPHGATLFLTGDAWNPSAAANTSRVGVTSNARWTLQSNVNWLTFTNISPANQTGNGEFWMRATANTSTAPRSGIVTVTAPGAPTRQIRVTQAGQAATLGVSPTTVPFTDMASSARIIVTSNATWNVRSSNTSWLTASHFFPANRTGHGEFWINATRNINTFQRVGTITVEAPGVPTRTINVTQAAQAPILSVSTPASGISFTSSASNATVNVTSNRTWTAVSNATSWLTVNPASGTNSGSFVISARVNSGGQRSGAITVSAPGATTRTINVTQAAAAAHLTISTHEWTPGAAGGPATVNVWSNRTWNVTSNNTGWLRVTATSPNQTNNGWFNLVADPNPLPFQRTARITVNAPGAPNRYIEVRQAAAATTLHLSRTNWFPHVGADSVPVTVTTNDTWVAISSDTSWLTVNPTSGINSGSFVISARANPYSLQRTGTITVNAGNQTRQIAVTQATMGPMLVLSRNEWPTGTSGTASAFFDITSNVTWARPVSNRDWLTVDFYSPNNRTGDGFIFITAHANPTNVERTGTITVRAPGVADQEIFVTQMASNVIIPTGVTISPSGSISLFVDQTQQLTATVTPPYATDRSVRWSSDRPLIATVDNFGMVRANAPGVAVITVETVSGGRRAFVDVSVSERDCICPPLPTLVTRMRCFEYLNMQIGWPLGHRTYPHAENRGINRALSRFGTRSRGELHLGLDIQHREGTTPHIYGTPVLAVVDGIVVLQATDSSRGHHIAIQSIEHIDRATGNPLIFLYNHLQYVPEFEDRERINRGDVIGLVGNSNAPDSTGHLHFEVSNYSTATGPTGGGRVGLIARRVNPLFFFPIGTFVCTSTTMDNTAIWNERDTVWIAD